MLGRIYKMFGSSPAPSRFEACDELNEIGKILTQLRAKKAELCTAQQNKGAASVDYGKFTIISALLKKIDAEIDVFNMNAVHQSHHDELRDVIVLITRIGDIVQQTLDEHSRTLNKFRDSTHETLSAVIDWTAFVTTISSLYIAPISILYKLGIYWGASSAAGGVNTTLKDYAGLTEENTRTMIILNGLSATLRQLKENLQLLVANENVMAEQP